tara:strand:- start:353 stop:1153 length:801 start_codon:yes stop_codon:yes gene_type:complete
MINLNKYNIQNIDNYNNNFQNNIIEICNKYINLINEYLQQCYKNIEIHNNYYKNYIIKKGINTISYIFKLLLIYTKNLDITYYNCQKSFIYYIEFIGQISDDDNSFLQLNSKDATLFIYKKTIFDINNDYRNNDLSNDDYNIINNLDLFINIHNNILFFIIEKNNINNYNDIFNTNVNSFFNKIIKIYIENNNNFLSDKLKSIIILSSNLNNFSSYNNYITCIEIFLKKLKKHNKIIDIDRLEFLIKNNKQFETPIKFINNLFNNI